MLSLERSLEPGSILIEYGHWRVREMTFTQEKIIWLWEEMKKYPTLFSDLTRNNVDLYKALLQNPYSYWLEVTDEEDKILGLMYLTDLDRGIDANIHLFFMDRKPTEKADLCRQMILHIFEKFPYLHRITVVVPSIYHATIRLARKIGFVQEGVKRQSQLIRHDWCDEVIMGILTGDLHG